MIKITSRQYDYVKGKAVYIFLKSDPGRFKLIKGGCRSTQLNDFFVYVIAKKVKSWKN